MKRYEDISKLYTAMASTVPTAAGSMNEFFSKTADTFERTSSIALKAALGNADITERWTKDSLERVKRFSSAKAESEDYFVSVQDFTSGMLESATETFAAYAEVAKRAQIDSFEIVLTHEK